MNSFYLIIWKVEHGSAAFLNSPNGKTVMFDAGSSDDFSPATWLVDNFGLNKSTNRLTKIMISHADKDHITDLPHVKTLIDPKILHRNITLPHDVLYPTGTSNLQEPLSTFKYMHETYTDPIDINDQTPPASNWGDVLIETFSCSPQQIVNCPQDKLKNNLSLVSYVRYKDFEIVFPGDLEPRGWEKLLENTNISQYVGKAQTRILVASHHGRESGIRFEVNGQKIIYDKFLQLMKPNLVIISDKWGAETTDPEAYRPYCEGTQVYYKNQNRYDEAKILTTKSNYAVTVTEGQFGGIVITAY